MFWSTVSRARSVPVGVGSTSCRRAWAGGPVEASGRPGWQCGPKAPWPPPVCLFLPVTERTVDLSERSYGFFCFFFYFSEILLCTFRNSVVRCIHIRAVVYSRWIDCFINIVSLFFPLYYCFFAVFLIFLLRYNWPMTLYWFQVDNILIQYLYMWQNDHHSKSSSHPSPHVVTNLCVYDDNF